MRECHRLAFACNGRRRECGFGRYYVEVVLLHDRIRTISGIVVTNDECIGENAFGYYFFEDVVLGSDKVCAIAKAPVVRSYERIGHMQYAVRYIAVPADRTNARMEIRRKHLYRAEERAHALLCSITHGEANGVSAALCVHMRR